MVACSNDKWWHGDARGLVHAEVRATLDARHQSRVGVGVQKIGERDRPCRSARTPSRAPHPRWAGPRPAAHTFCSLSKAEKVEPSYQNDRLCGVARRVAHQPVGTTHGHVTQVGELAPGTVVGHLVVQLLRLERESLGAGEPLAHLPHDLVSARIQEARPRRQVRLNQGWRRFGGGVRHGAATAGTSQAKQRQAETAGARSRRGLAERRDELQALTPLDGPELQRRLHGARLHQGQQLREVLRLAPGASGRRRRSSLRSTRTHRLRRHPPRCGRASIPAHCRTRCINGCSACNSCGARPEGAVNLIVSCTMLGRARSPRPRRTKHRRCHRVDRPSRRRLTS